MLSGFTGVCQMKTKPKTVEILVRHWRFARLLVADRSELRGKDSLI
jgi:hypothetical protein